MELSDKTTNILIISQHFPPDKSGNASRIHDMALHLSTLGLNVIIVAPFPSFPHGTFEKNYNISKKSEINPRIQLINIFSWQPKSENPSFLSRILYYLSFPVHSSIWCGRYGKDYDTIITSAPPVFTLIPGLLSKIFLKKKWIIDKRDMWIDASICLGFIKKGGLFEITTRKFVNFCFKYSDAILVTTNGIKNKLLQKYSNSKNIYLIPNGVDPDFFKPLKKPKKRRIVYTGNVGHAQNLECFILAMELLKKYKIQLLIVGDGDNKSNLELMVKEKNLKDLIIFKGMVQRKKVPSIISKSLVAIAPLKTVEGLDYAIPSKIYEYMSCEVPFIVTGSGQVQKLVDDSKAGVFVNSNPEDISKAILKLFNNPKIIEEMGKNGRNYVKTYYNRAEIAKNLKNIIEEIK